MATPDPSEEAPPQKKSRLTFGKCAQMPKSGASLPDLSRLTQEVATLPAPKPVMEKLRGPLLFVGIDVETHALVPRGSSQASFWRTGEFGFLTTADDDALSFLGLHDRRFRCAGRQDLPDQTGRVRHRERGHGEARHQKH